MNAGLTPAATHRRTLLTVFAFAVKDAADLVRRHRDMLLSYVHPRWRFGKAI